MEDIDGWSGGKYDVICALNLLDRCSRPKTLLEQIRSALKPDGLFLLALVWPFQPYVEMSPDHRPEEELDVDSSTFQRQVSSLVRHVLEPLGFEVVHWSKVPYLCEGDLQRTFYHLPDMILALRLVDSI